MSDEKEATPADAWKEQIGGLFSRYNQEIIQLTEANANLTAEKAQLEYSIGQVADVILRLCPELIQTKEGGVPESVCDCAIRLITEYVQTRKGTDAG